MEPVPRIGMKVIDPIYLLSKPDLKRDFLYFDKLAIDPSGFKLCYSAAGLMCLGRHADPDQFLVPFKRDIDFLTSKGLIEEIQYYRLDIADELEQNPDAKSALQQGHDEIRRGLETHRKGQLFKPAPPNISAAYGIKTGMDVTFIYGVISPIYGVHAWLHPG